MKEIKGKSVKNVKHRTEEVEFEGIIYECRVVEDKDGEELLIGSHDLNNALHPGEWGDENDGFASEEAEEIYDDIFFFMDCWDLIHLSDEELREELKKEHPDWFD